MKRQKVNAQSIIVALLAVAALCAVLVGCSSGQSSSSSDSSYESEYVTSSENIDAEASIDGQVAEDVGEQDSDSGVAYENMPVPDFSKLFTLNKAEAADYLAAYPHETSPDNDDLIERIGWTEFYSSDTLEEEWGSNWKYNKGEYAPGSWSMKLNYYDDSDTCSSIDFYMPPLSSYGSSSDILVPSETYAAMIANYLADFDVQEMTVSLQDVNSGRDGNYANDFAGYVLFDDLQADVDTYSLRIFPNPNPNPSGFNWEEVKGWISQGYYLDKHSGGVTYTYPYIDVYSTADDI